MTKSSFDNLLNTALNPALLDTFGSKVTMPSGHVVAGIYTEEHTERGEFGELMQIDASVELEPQHAKNLHSGDAITVGGVTHTVAHAEPATGGLAKVVLR